MGPTFAIPFQKMGSNNMKKLSVTGRQVNAPDWMVVAQFEERGIYAASAPPAIETPKRAEARGPSHYPVNGDYTSFDSPPRAIKLK
jgi:hypothetical protein